MKQNDVSRSAGDDEYWEDLSVHFSKAVGYINLENGYCGTLPRSVLAALQHYQIEVNSKPSLFLRTQWRECLLEIKRKLAAFCGVEADEILITHNLTEAMSIVLNAYPFESDDEILYADTDYDGVHQIIGQVASRRHVETKCISIADQSIDDEDIVMRYESAITQKTRVIILTHLLHRNGQIMPVQRIAEMAKRYHVDVVVDAAQSFGQLHYQFPELGADFVCVNLHKWLGAPLGTGLLYVRRSRRLDLLGGHGDLGALRPTGTLSPAPVMAIIDAIDFHQSIGTRNIEGRLRHLSQYWLAQVSLLGGLNRHIRFHTPVDPQRYCAIIAISIDGVPAQEAVDYLMREHQIFTVARVINGMQVIRITPHIFTHKLELDRLVSALKMLIGGA